MFLRVIFFTALFALATISCKQYKGVYREGKYHSVTNSWKYPALVFPMKIVGTRTLIDTAEGRVLERTKFRSGVGLFGTVQGYRRTTTYDTLGRKTKVVTVKGD